ncbi:MAG: hypothetical protein AAF581_23090 [Planctomycetota bacterium]
MQRSSTPREQGSILVMAVIFTFVIAMLVAGTVSTAVNEAKNTTTSIDQADAMSLAEGVTEAAQKEMLETVANFNSPSMSGIIAISGTDYNYGVTQIGGSITRTDIDGVNLVIQPYLLTSEVAVGDTSSTISRVVELTMTPIFQYMIFFNDDLEILPGPNMTLGGRVHANADIYVGCGATLNVESDYFRCTGNILREKKSNGQQTGGTVNIKEFGETTMVDMTPSMDSTNTNWATMAMTEWGGTVQDGSHGVTEVEAPQIGSIKAYDSGGAPGYYHDHAGLVIRDGQAFDEDGDPITLPAGVISEVSMYDAREDGYVTLTEIDVAALGTSGYYPTNGLLYAYRSDATVGDPHGIRLTNGSELPASLTVVTENPLYVQGDYNTVNKKGAAVMADAVNLLSNSWNDTKSAGNLPAASNTWYNLAMVTGNVPTPDGGGAYSGGFENLPRFHENWSGRTASIRGSFIKIFESEYAMTPITYGGDHYTAPTRDWLYDPDLNDLANMPPFTPNAVYFRRVTWDDNVPMPFSTEGMGEVEEIQ